MAEKAKAAGINTDYFSPNFVIQMHTDLLYCIDYECNEYSEEWNFENWGVKYWSQTPEFLAHLDYLRKRAKRQREEFCRL
jgi:hypothetical protein